MAFSNHVCIWAYIYAHVCTRVRYSISASSHNFNGLFEG